MNYTGGYTSEVMFVVTRFLVQQGSGPEDIEHTAGRKMLDAADGLIDGPAFRAELAKRRPGQDWVRAATSLRRMNIDAG